MYKTLSRTSRTERKVTGSLVARIRNKYIILLCKHYVHISRTNRQRPTKRETRVNMYQVLCWECITAFLLHGGCENGQTAVAMAR
jgi:hypothetical protein